MWKIKCNATLQWAYLHIKHQIIYVSAPEHIDLIYRKKLMRPDIGFWFGLTFDDHLGKYTVDLTGEIFDVDRYSLRGKVSETKQVSLTTWNLFYTIYSVCWSPGKIWGILVVNRQLFQNRSWSSTHSGIQ